MMPGLTGIIAGLDAAGGGGGGGGGSAPQYIVFAGGQPVFINQSASADREYLTLAGYVNEKT